MSSVNMSSDMPMPGVGHVWRTKDGAVCGTMRFGSRSWPYLTFDSPAEARAHAAAAIRIAEAMERLEAESGGEGAEHG